MVDKSGARARVQSDGVQRSMFRRFVLMAAITVVLGVIALVVIVQRGATMSRIEVLLLAGIMSAPFLGFLVWSVLTRGGTREPRASESGPRRFPE